MSRQVIIKFKGGKVDARGEGFRGKACEGPLGILPAILGGTVTKSCETEEAGLPEEPIENVETGEALA